MARSAAPRATRVPDIRTGDQVLVLTGRDAGKRGTVERVLRGGRGPGGLLGRHSATTAGSLDRVAVVVEGLNIAKRHTKPRAKQGRTDRQPRIQQGGILDIAQPIPASKVMIICPHCSQPTRVRHATAADGRSVRVCRNCGEVLTGEARKS